MSDRVAIMNDGQIVAYGSPLFLKHRYGGYSLHFEASDPLDVSKYVDGAVSLPIEKPRHFRWKIEHGSEPSFAGLLSKLDEHGAKNVALELTTLEQVFLETSKEDQDLDGATSSDSDHRSDGVDEEGSEGIEISLHRTAEDNDTSSWLGKIWEKRGNVTAIGFWTKFYLVQDFMKKNAWKQKGALIVNVMFPLVRTRNLSYLSQREKSDAHYLYIAYCTSIASNIFPPFPGLHGSRVSSCLRAWRPRGASTSRAQCYFNQAFGAVIRFKKWSLFWCPRVDG